MFYSCFRQLFFLCSISFFLFDCGKPERKLKNFAAHINQDTAKRLADLSDDAILDFVYGKCSSDKILDGNQYAFVEFHGADSILMKCEHPVCFNNFGDSLCYVRVRGIISDTGNIICKQLSMLMKYRKNCWEPASPITTDMVINPGKLAGIEYCGPYTLLRYSRENFYGNEFTSANDSYLCFYEANFFPAGNYPLKKNKSAETNLRNQGIVKVSYNDSLKFLEYYFCGVENGRAIEEKNICVGDTSFTVLNVNNHADPPDTITYISANRLKQIVQEFYKK